MLYLIIIFSEIIKRKLKSYINSFKSYLSFLIINSLKQLLTLKHKKF